MRYLVISCSLSPSSRSRILARIAHQHLEARGLGAEFIELADLNLPLCDGASVYGQPAVQEIGEKIARARGVILAAAIYNYDVNSAAKNLIELTGDAWTDKVVGFVCAAGGHGSYMSVMPFANSLMLDFRCVIIPRFVYTIRAAPEDKLFGDQVIHARTEELTTELVRITDALFPV